MVNQSSLSWKWREQNHPKAQNTASISTDDEHSVTDQKTFINTLGAGQLMIELVDWWWRGTTDNRYLTMVFFQSSKLQTAISTRRPKWSYYCHIIMIPRLPVLRWNFLCATNISFYIFASFSDETLMLCDFKHYTLLPISSSHAGLIWVYLSGFLNIIYRYTCTENKCVVLFSLCWCIYNP